MIIQLKYFNDSLNIVVILAPGREFFSSKYVQPPLRYTNANLKISLYVCVHIKTIP